MADELDAGFWLPDEFLDDDFFSDEKAAAVAAAKNSESDEEEALAGLSRRMAGLDCDGGGHVWVSAVHALRPAGLRGGQPQRRRLAGQLAALLAAGQAARRPVGPAARGSWPPPHQQHPRAQTQLRPAAAGQALRCAVAAGPKGPLPVQLARPAPGPNRSFPSPEAAAGDEAPAAGHGHGVGHRRLLAARAEPVRLAAAAEGPDPRRVRGRRHARRVPHPSWSQARVHRHRRLHPPPGRRPRRAQEETKLLHGSSPGAGGTGPQSQCGGPRRPPLLSRRFRR